MTPPNNVRPIVTLALAIGAGIATGNAVQRALADQPWAWTLMAGAASAAAASVLVVAVVTVVRRLLRASR